MDSSPAGLLHNTPNWKHFSLSGSGDVGERMRERTGGNREFIGESMPWVGRDFTYSGIGGSPGSRFVWATHSLGHRQ